MTPFPLITELGIKGPLPLIQAPMAGGITTPHLVAAVSNCGGLGSLATGYVSPEVMESDIDAIRSLTTQPFAANIFVIDYPACHSDTITRMQEKLAIFRKDLGLPLSPPLALPNFSFEDQVEVIIAKKVPICSFTFNLLPASLMKRMRAAGIYLIGTATNLEEALLLEQSGCDAVVIQGSEAGGHQGSFLYPDKENTTPLITLLSRVSKEVSIPVIAAGGIMDGEAMVHAILEGASAVQMGTVFLTTHESGASPAYKNAVLAPKENHTIVTRCFSGRLGRALGNHFTHSMAAYPYPIPAFPLQHYLTRDIRIHAAKYELADYLALWAGEGVGKGNYAISVQELFTLLESQVHSCVNQFTHLLER